MTLLPDWKKILTRAWSVRFLVIGIALEGSAEVIKFWVDSGAASPALRILGAMSLAGAVAARLVQQDNLSGGKS